MNPLRYMKALFGLGDIDAFWKAREEILARPGKHPFENYLCKVIRKHYGAGIPIPVSYTHLVVSSADTANP